MIRGENIVCGTTTTGTGTLTLAATPSAIGAIDPFAAFSGLGLGTSNATPLPYIIIEYTDSTFAKPSQVEKGFGNLLIGASIGATTLTRNPLVTQVSGAYTNGTFSTPATAITIGTAANVLVFIGASAWDQAQALHAYDTSGAVSGNSNVGVQPWGGGGAVVISGVSGVPYYSYVKLDTADVIKSCTIRIVNAITTPTSSSLAIALYAVASSGLPGKKLIDFGNVAGANPLGTANANLTATASAGVPIMAGGYIVGILPIWSGGTGSPQFRFIQAVTPSPFGLSLSSALFPIATIGTNGGQSSLTDPAFTTGATTLASNSDHLIACAFKNS